MGESRMLVGKVRCKREGMVMGRGVLLREVKRKRDNNKVEFTRLLRAAPYLIIISFGMLRELIIYELFNCN